MPPNESIAIGTMMSPPRPVKVGTEIRAVREALIESGGNQTQATRRPKIPRHVLVYRMKK